MPYETELRFAQDILSKNHIQTLVIDSTAPLSQMVDTSLYVLLASGRDDTRCFADFFPSIDGHTIYKVTDIFACRYLFLQLPDRREVFVVGPYVVRDIERQTFLEVGENAGLEPSQIAMLERFCTRLPLISTEENYVLSLLNTLGERLWGGGNFTVEEVSREDAATLLRNVATESVDADARWSNARIMEERYAYENEMMEAISHGHLHKAEQMLSAFSTLAFESRAADPLRNLKNYCIITNTLFRKAAQNGGVHPVHLDALSSDFAKRIESFTSIKQAQPLMFEMFRSYCRLVRDHSIRQYSPAVQKVILLIDADITADLSLSSLAREINVSAGYLSSLFRRETGDTLTAYVNRRRVDNAKRLLRTTRLQIQTIAQHCGIVDVHYFAKIFKKQVGITPKEYRESRRG